MQVVAIERFDPLKAFEWENPYKEVGERCRLT